MKTKQSTRKLVLSALFAAITFVSTLIHIHVPGMQTGYVNLGDCLVLTCGILLGPFYGALAAGIGSALTDFLHGYVVYVLPTFVIKALMAVCAYYIYKLLSKDETSYKIIPLTVAGIFSEIIMIVGYFLYEGFFIVTFSGALLGVPGNITQGVMGVIFSVILIRVIKTTKIYKML